MSNNNTNETYSLDYNGKLNINEDDFMIESEGDMKSIKTVLDDLKTNIIKSMYPIGSIYMSTNEIPGNKYIDNEIMKINWLGCVWSPVKENRFLRAAGVQSDGDTWEFINGGNTGGSEDHTHNYGIRYAGHTEIYGADGESIQLWNGEWKNSRHEGTKNNYSYSDTHSSGNMAMYENITNTTSSSNIPPYKNIYMYERIE